MTSELPVNLLSCFSPRGNSFLDCSKAPEMLPSPVATDESDKSAVGLSEDPSHSAAVIVPPLGVGVIIQTIGSTKIVDPVIAGVSVDVVDLVWNWLTVDQQPCQAMRQISATVYGDMDVTASFLSSGNLSGELSVRAVAYARTREM
jgi:hypothetical protein